MYVFASVSMSLSFYLMLTLYHIDLALSPEVAYPVAMNEIIAAYTDLIQNHGVNSKRIILCRSTTLLYFTAVFSLSPVDYKRQIREASNILFYLFMI